MFFEHFGLSEQPFNVAADPRFIYNSHFYSEARASLINGIESGPGFSCLLGDSGLGKTTLICSLLERFSGSSRVGLIYPKDCGYSELLRHILDGFEMSAPEDDVDAMLRVFCDMVAAEEAAGRRVILFVDQAHDLSTSALETLRQLFNPELPSAAAPHVVLAGKPYLYDNLSHPDLASLRGQLITLARLKPLSINESIAYLEHRLRAAGQGATPVFTPEAMEVLAEKARGVPREINRLALNSMNLACALRRTQVDETNVRDVLKELVPERATEAMPVPGPVLVSEQVTPPPVFSQSPPNYTWGSQALAVAPAPLNEHKSVAAEVQHEPEVAKAAEPAAPPTPKLQLVDPARELRYDLLDNEPAPRLSPNTRYMARKIRRILLVAGATAAVLICAAGLVILGGMAWKTIANLRASTPTQADKAPTTPTSQPSTPKKPTRSRGSKAAPDTFNVVQTGSAGTALASGNTGAAGLPSTLTPPVHRTEILWPYNASEFKIPGMTIIPIPYQRSAALPRIDPPVLQFRVEPEYPSDAKALHLQGTVKIRLHLDRSGHVDSMIVLSGKRVLAQPALAAVRQWVFSPFQENGAPFEGNTTVDLQFMGE